MLTPEDALLTTSFCSWLLVSTRFTWIVRVGRGWPPSLSNETALSTVVAVPSADGMYTLVRLPPSGAAGTFNRMISRTNRSRTLRPKPRKFCCSALTRELFPLSL
uniref:(northern house mosquito) hypothetical protein n=1 Tax=Culex pipiens TaxID=7175 RepID=A0A8D8JWP6_CULPI